MSGQIFIERVQQTWSNWWNHPIAQWEMTMRGRSILSSKYAIQKNGKKKRKEKKKTLSPVDSSAHIGNHKAKETQ